MTLPAILVQLINQFVKWAGVETFTSLRAFVYNPHYHQQRHASLQMLDLSVIDAPIIDIVRGFSKLEYCFTLQSCFGHFLYPGNMDPLNLKPLQQVEGVNSIEYRIAYLAICIEDSIHGKELFENLAKIPSLDPQYIQFGSADWFWDRQLNSFALQVEPLRHMNQDKCCLEPGEALHIEKVRNRFFDQLRTLLQVRLGNGG